MTASPADDPAAQTPPGAHAAATTILLALSFSHLLNDMIQSLFSSIYPILKENFQLDFGQIGLISLVFQVTASLLQPFVGLYTDRRPLPHSLTVGMGFSLAGLVVLAIAPTYGFLLLAAALVGTGSSVFHPESSRIARLASGGRHGLAQSIFQVGGNTGQALGRSPPRCSSCPTDSAASPGSRSLALIAMVVLWNVGGWFGRNRVARAARQSQKATVDGGADFAPNDDCSARRSRRSDLLEVLLPGGHRQLLHLLSHRPVRRVRAGGADLPVRLPRRLGRRAHSSAGRSATASAGRP